MAAGDQVLPPATTVETLADLLDELGNRVRALIDGHDEYALSWRPDPGGNSVGVTVWHFTRWLDVVSVRLLDGLPSHDELWLSEGWARMSGYDPRGLGEGGLGVLTGYSIGEVLAVPKLSSAQLLDYLGQVTARLRPQLLRLTADQLGGDAPGAAVMTARAASTGWKDTYGWIKLILVGALQHVGEVAAMLALRNRVPEADGIPLLRPVPASQRLDLSSDSPMR
jgi:DinB superfamily